MTKLGAFCDLSHDSNIAIARNSGGRIKFAVAEERLSRKIQDGRPPSKSIAFANRLKHNTYDHLVIPGRAEPDSLREFRKAGLSPFHYRIGELRNRWIDSLGLSKVERTYIPHLQAHAGAAFYCSSYREAYVFVADGGNAWDPWTCGLFHGTENELKCIDLSMNDFTDLYMFATAILGFKPVRHEGKVTGLAAWNSANPNLRSLILELCEEVYRSGKSISSNFIRWKSLETSPELSVNQEKIEEYRRKLGNFTREELAFEVQRITEETTKEYLKKNLPSADLPLCLAGGLFANIKLNQKFPEMGFPGIYIHPAMGDAGLTVGALAYVNAESYSNRNYLHSVLLGPSFSDNHIKETLSNHSLNYQICTDIEKTVAKLLSNGKIIARVAGPLEYGPRALGNRSILCSAQDKSQILRLNEMLNRDHFMPFAPAILDEYFDICVDNARIFREPSLWMTISVDASPSFRDYAPDLVHVDGTIRPQCVAQDLYPEFHAILKEYQHITGIPVVLNTSFNMHGEPIVCSVEDAIMTFLRTKIDALVIENYLVQR